MRALAVVAVLFPLALPAQTDAGLASLCQQIAPAIQGSVTPGQALPLPTEAKLAAIAAFVADRPVVLTPGTTAVFAVSHAWPEDEDAEARLVRVPVGDAAGRQLVLIASVDGQIRGGAVVDKDGKLVAEGGEFLAQFVGKNLPSPGTVVARAKAAALLVASEQGADAASKATAALIDVRRQMAAQAVAAGAILQALEHGAAPAEAHVATARAAYVAMQRRAADLAPTLGKSHGDYDRLVARVLAHLDGLAKAGDAPQRQAAHKALQGDCRDCHELTSDAFSGGFEEFAVNERLRRGLGNQSFLVGYDVVAAGLDGDAAQLLADAGCRAVLLLDLARN